MATWTDTRMTMAQVEQVLTAQWVAKVRTFEHPELFCDCRATGAWDACEPEHFAAYTSLAALLRAGK